MLNTFLKVLGYILNILKLIAIPIGIAAAVFTILCFIWYVIFRCKGMKMNPTGQVPQKRPSLFKQLFVLVPRKFMLDKFQRETDYFTPRGIHMFCGEQGCGKTIAAVEMITRLQRQFPKAKVITNFGLTTETTELAQWEQLLTYTNGHKGVIVGIDEIQNWFMSGLNKLPEGMLEVATQNRKNNRILCCTAQVFTRVNKGLREQVNLVYEPHTFFGCFTVVIMRKPKFDSEGNVIERKYRGMYCFTHTDELRAAYDTYKVIHTLAKEGFKEVLPQTTVTNVYVAAPKGK